MILKISHQGANPIRLETPALRPPKRAPRRVAWKWPVVVSVGLHVVVGAVLAYVVFGEREAPTPNLSSTQCAFVEPALAQDDRDEDVAELEPAELEEFEPLPELDPVEMPDAPVLEEAWDEDVPTLDVLLDTPSLQVSPRMFKRRKVRVPPPVAPPPTARPPVPTAVPVTVPVRVAPSRARRGGNRLKARFIPPSARYYPSEARRRGIQGTVIVIVTVNARGAVIHVKVSRSSGSRLLDEAAVRLMYDARFNPPGSEQKAKAPVNFILH